MTGNFEPLGQINACEQGATLSFGRDCDNGGWMLQLFSHDNVTRINLDDRDIKHLVKLLIEEI